MPGRPPLSIRLRPAAAVLVTVVAVAGCDETLLKVAPPTPRNAVVPVCNRLNDHLPNLLENLQSRRTTPRSPLVHAWGSRHPVVLRCGVPTPPGFSPDSTQTAKVDDVTWFQQIEDQRVVWTAIRKTADVELSVPKAYPEQGAFLVDVGSAIAASIP